jgi:hypothetical protein
VINGVELVGVRSQFTFNGEHGAYRVEFADGFTGEFDPFTVTASDEALQVRGGALGSVLRGRGARATINGEQRISENSRFKIAAGGVEAVLRFADGFTGEFEPVTVSGATLSSASVKVTSDSASATLDQITATLSDPNAGADVGDESARHAGSSTGDASEFLRDPRASAKAQLVSRLLRDLVRTDPHTLLATLNPAVVNDLQYRQMLVSLLR